MKNRKIERRRKEGRDGETVISPKMNTWEFDLCLTNNCNLGCEYCYHASLCRDKRSTLDYGQIEAGLRNFLGGVNLRKLEKVTIAGGEPLLCFPLVKKTVALVKKLTGGRASLMLYTNGTLLTAERARYLLDQGVKVTISLDGAKKSNDTHRRYYGGGGSVFDTVTGNLRGFGPELLARLNVNMTFTPKTVDDLAYNFRFLREMGFAEVLLNMDTHRVWPPERLAALRASLRELKKYFCELAGRRKDSFEDYKFGVGLFVIMDEEKGALDHLRTFREVSLAPDGYFYPSGFVSTYGAMGAAYRIGHYSTGIDFGRMLPLRRKVVDYLRRMERRCSITEYIANPVLLYFGIVLKKADPLAVFRNIRRVFGLFYEELGQFMAVEKALDCLSSCDGFGDLAHRPPEVTNRPLGRLDLALAPGGLDDALAAARPAVDQLLYAPGGAKTLLLRTGSPAGTFEIARHLALYALLKAGSLGKKVRIFSACSGREQAGFFREHGVFTLHGEDAAAAPEGGRCAAVLPLLPGRASGLASRLEKLRRRGFRRFLLEPGGAGWDQSALRELRSGLAGAATWLSGLAPADRPLFEGAAAALRGRPGEDCVFSHLWSDPVGKFRFFGEYPAGLSRSQGGLFGSCLPEGGGCPDCPVKAKGPVPGLLSANAEIGAFLKSLPLGLPRAEAAAYLKRCLDEEKESSAFFQASRREAGE